MLHLSIPEVTFMIHYQRFKNRIIVLFSENSVLEHSIADAFRQEGGTVVVLNKQDNVEAVFTQYGRIDVFVAIPPKTNPDIALTEVASTDWKTRCFEYAEAFFLFAGKTASLMSQRQEGGVILAVCSASAAQSGSDQDVCASILHASIRHFIKCGVIQWAAHRIRCQTLFYGGLEALPDIGAKTPSGRITIHSPILPRAVSGNDVAEAVLFLCSDDAVFMSSCELNIDAGVGAGPDIFTGKNSLGNATYDQFLKAGVLVFDGSKRQTSPIEDSEAISEEILSRTPPTDPQTVLVTGVSRGLGKALTERLIAEGHTVLGCARSAKTIDELRQTYGAPHCFEVVDLTNRRQVVAWAESLKNRNVIPDFIMNNAAIIGDEPYHIWKITEECFQEVFMANVMSAVNMIHAFVPIMFRRMKGIIVNFSSGYGREFAPNIAQYAMAKVAPYSMSKWCIESLSRCLAAELPTKMACVSLHPGNIHTESMAKGFGRYADRYPTPEEWAMVAVPFLLSLTPQDNGKAISVPGMTEFRGMARPS